MPTTPPTFVAAAANSEAASATVVVPMPVGAAENDELLAVVSFVGDVSTGAPAGWERVSEAVLQHTDAGQEVEVFRQRLTNVSAALANFTFTAAGSCELVAVILAYRGVDPDAPVHVFSSTENLSGTDHEAPLVEASINNTVLLSLFALFFAVSGTTPPTGTERAAEESTGAGSFAYEQTLGTGTAGQAQGPNVLVDASSGTSFGISMLLAPVPNTVVDARDLYKSQILRNTLPKSYDRRRTSMFAKVTAVLGESDNNIGGLFGNRNFLNEDE